MGVFNGLIPCRSDGAFDIRTKNGVKELNQPTASQLNATPDNSGNVDCYRRIEPESEKDVDWRRKLGGMLADTLKEIQVMHHLSKLHICLSSQP